MNAMVRFTLASLRANRVRTFVTIVGVALAAALLTAVLTTYTSLVNFLYETEATLSGTWSAMAQQNDSSQLQQEINEASNASDVVGLATLEDVGFAQLNEQQQKRFGHYLTILNMGGDAETVCAMHPSVGRLPQSSDEIMLWENWRRDGMHVGDQLTLSVGQRQITSVPSSSESQGTQGEGGPDADLAQDQSPAPARDVFESTSSEGLVVGQRLDSTMGFFDPEAEGYGETLVDVQERTYTIVGFYEHSNQVLMSGCGTSAITVDDAASGGLVSTYVSLDGMQTQDQVHERMQELFPNAAAITPHTALLNFSLIAGGRTIWATFFGLAIVLAIIIVTACVSLIYNAFAISVIERTSQFGLLSSVGASKRQLRRAVLLEASLITCAGIPLGVIVGLVGCVITFAILSPAIVSVLGSVGVEFSVHVVPWALALVVLLALVTVLLSALVPALRASRMSIIDSLHSGKGSRVSKRGMRKAAKSTDATKLWKRGRILGMGSVLASIGRKRGATKGRAASVSLALSIVLLMTAGSLTTFLGTLTNAVDMGVGYDVELSVYPMDDDDASANIYTDPAMEANLKSIYETASEASGAELVGWMFYSNMNASIPETMVGTAMIDGHTDSGRMADGNWSSYVQASFIDDEMFSSYAQQVGADPSAFSDPSHPKAIAISTVYGNNGETYEMQELLNRVGTMQLYTGGTYGDQEIPFISYQWSTNDSGEATIRLIPQVPVDEGDDIMKDIDLNDPALSLDSVAVDVVALTDQTPPIVRNRGNLQLVMPHSLMPAFEKSTVSWFSMGGYNVKSGASSDQVTQDIEQATSDRISNMNADQGSFAFYTNNYAGMENNNRMTILIVNVFCLLFTVILALIAMANVFNTVTNSLILRRREFAVMRSIGLSGRQFRRMIASECVGFTIAGLVPGMVVSVIVSYLLYAMVAKSVESMTFTLPWGYVALAVGMTVASMLASVAYGMYRCKTDNVVEALRADNV